MYRYILYKVKRLNYYASLKKIFDYAFCLMLKFLANYNVIKVKFNII